MLKEEASQSSRNSVSSGSGPVVTTACHLQCGKTSQSENTGLEALKTARLGQGTPPLREASANRGYHLPSRLAGRLEETPPTNHLY